MKINLGNIIGIFILVCILGLFGGLVFRGACVTFVENYELGYSFDNFSGKITKLDRTGYFAYNPIKKSVHTVDLRPFQVCINANSRVLNCKLIQFNPAGLELFLQWHGRQNYDIYQTTSSAGSTSNSTFMEIMKSYAYDTSTTNYPFLIVNKSVDMNNAGAAIPPLHTP